MAAHRPTLIFTPLHRIEFRNACRNIAATGLATTAECVRAFEEIETALRDEILVHTAVNWTEAFRHADILSEAHATRHGPRTLDLLHVAIALECGAKLFLSFDARQRKLAAAAGLKVRP